MGKYDLTIGLMLNAFYSYSGYNDDWESMIDAGIEIHGKEKDFNEEEFRKEATEAFKASLI